MSNHRLGEKYNEWLGRLYRGGKWAKVIYWFLVIGTPICSFMIGILITLLVTGGMMYVEHYGWFGKSSFGYMNLNQDSFRTQFYQNSSFYFQTLKVGNSWKNDIGARTTFKTIPENAIDIGCWVESPNQNCNDYQIEGGKHQILNLNISVRNPPTKEYKLCVTTKEGNNPSNSNEDCTLNIFILSNPPNAR